MKEAVHKNRHITICNFSNDEAAALRSYQSVLTQNEHIRSWQICALYVDWKAAVVYFGHHLEKHQETPSFKVTTDDDPKTCTTIFSGRIHYLSTQRRPNMLYEV